MKCLCIGDVHVKVSNVIEIDQMIQKLVELASKISPNFIVVLGDVLDRHATIHVSCLIRAEKLIMSLSKIAPTFVLVGNHDRPNNSNFLTEEHPFNAMKLWPNTYIIDKVFSYVFNGAQILEADQKANTDDYRFIFTPYVPPGRLDEALKTISNPYQDVTCYFAHQEIVGAKMGAIVSTEGDNWPEDNALMISGHIHDYDFLQNNMVYVGVPLMHSFGDKPDKTVSVFTFTEKEWQQERVDLGLIKKITIYLTPEQVINYSPPKDKQVKLVIKGDEASIKAIIKLEKIQQLKKQGLKVVFKTQITEMATTTITPKMSFRDRLVSVLKEVDSNSLIWFNKIFIDQIS